MLRAFLLASPFVLIAVVSCGDSSATFDDGPGGSAGTNSAPGGTGTTGTSPGGKNATAGSPATNGGSNPAGQGGSIGGSSKGGQGGGNSGTVSNGGTKNNAGSANNGGTANQAGSAGHGGASNGGTPTDPGGAPNAGAAGSDAGAAGMAGSSPTGPQCPDLFGTYKVKNKDGMCAGMNKDSPQSIEGNTETCVGHFVSDPMIGPAGVNGSASIDADGNFTGAALNLDKAQRSPCSGVWDATAETMTVTCGGQADVCTVLLELQ